MKSIRWKIVFTSLVLVFIPIYFLNRYAISFFDLFTRTELETHLKHYAYIVGEEYRSLLDAQDVQVHEHIQAHMEIGLQGYGREIGSRIRVISTNGVVVLDSIGDGDVGALLTDRPEIREALTGAYSARSRLTPDKGFMYYYIARPVKNANKDVLGVVYIARHTAPIITAIREMVTNQRRATQVALAVAAVVALFVAQTLTRRLRRLTRKARAFAEGNANLDINVNPKPGDEIEELGRAVSRMAAEIEARNDYNRDFISTTFHELKAPLTAVKGAVEILEQERGGDAETQTRFLSTILYQTERMIRMTGELSELTRLDVEMLRGMKETAEYCQFVRDVVERIEPTFDEARAPFECQIPDGPIEVMIVPGRIEQVISNLLENAFRYTSVSGRVRLVVEQGEDGTVLTHVEDTGRGVAPSNINKVFDRFFTTEPKDRPKEYGSGLGLAIARTIVENHGGRIWVQSPWPDTAQDGSEEGNIGPGARFTFSLATSRRHN